MFSRSHQKDHQQNCKNSDSDFITFVYECTVPRSDNSGLWGQKFNMAFQPHYFVEKKLVQCFSFRLVFQDLFLFLYSIIMTGVPTTHESFQIPPDL